MLSIKHISSERSGRIKREKERNNINYFAERIMAYCWVKAIQIRFWFRLQFDGHKKKIIIKTNMLITSFPQRVD